MYEVEKGFKLESITLFRKAFQICKLLFPNKNYTYAYAEEKYISLIREEEKIKGMH